MSILSVNSQNCKGTESKSPKITLVLLMGLPGSGKSTLAKAICKKLLDKGSGGVVALTIAYDEFVHHDIQAQCATLSLNSFDLKSSGTKALRTKFIKCVSHIINLITRSTDPDPNSTLQLSPEFQDILSNSVFEEKTKAIEEFIKCKINPSSSVVLLIDDNHYYSSMRTDFFQLAKQYQIGFCILYCKTSLKICRERNSLREGAAHVSDSNIVEMSLKLEEPNPMKIPCDVFCVQINQDEDQNTTNTNIQLIIEVLENSLINPVEWAPPADRSSDIELDRRICSQNEIHQADQVLRKWINKELASKMFNSVGRKGMGADLNRKKNLVLEKLRNGEFKIVASVNQDLEFREEIINFVNSLEK